MLNKRLMAPLKASTAQISPMIVSTEEAATILGLAPRTLQDFRLRGEGPPFVKLTRRRVGYFISDLEAWARARTVKNTSQEVAEKGAV